MPFYYPQVFESRGMQVCEEALKLMKNSKRQPVRGVLHVSRDGLRVVDSATQGLVLDQTIEKVSTHRSQTLLKVHRVCIIVGGGSLSWSQHHPRQFPPSTLRK